jgi:hypothetical protein
VLYKTLKPREIVRGCPGAPHHAMHGIPFRKRANEANTSARGTLSLSANIPVSGLNIQGIEYSQVFDGTGVDRPNGA